MEYLYSRYAHYTSVHANGCYTRSKDDAIYQEITTVCGRVTARVTV